MEVISLFGGLAVCVILFFNWLSSLRNPWRKRQRSYPRSAKPRVVSGIAGDIADPRVQLDAVASVDFEPIKIMNRPEFRVFQALEDIVAEGAPGHRVMAQVSLGEVIRPVKDSAEWPERRRAFSSINSKRLDMVVVDARGYLALAVEYQGSGHHQKKAFLRDAVKKEALRRAGVAFLEVEKGTKPSEFAMRVRNALGIEAVAEVAAE